jgi:hypothetical protein
MFKKVLFWLTSFTVLGFSLTALAQDVDPNDAGALVTGIIEAAKGGEWSLLVSLALMMLVFLATKIPFISNWIPGSAKPWVVAISGVVLAVAMTAATTGDWVTALLNGLVMGTAATGLWELIGKKLLGSSTS